MSFGRIISEARKKMNLSQKELAATIKKEDGDPISPQYLNDIERDRRNAPSDHLLEQFAKLLDLDLDVLYFYAGELPADIRAMNPPQENIKAAYAAFRKSIEE